LPAAARRDRLGELHHAGARHGGGQAGQDRQDLLARHHRRQQDAGLSAAQLHGVDRAAGQVGSAAGPGPTHTTYNDDILNCWVGIGAQIDGLGHIGVGDVYYNGNKWGEFAAFDGLKKLGVEKIRRSWRAASCST
jgi:hypothetical protein